MDKTVYEIIESFIPFEKLKKSRSLVNLKVPNNKTKCLSVSKSSIVLTSNPLSSDRNNEETDINHLQNFRKKKELLSEITKLQLKAMDIREKAKDKAKKEKLFKKEEEKMKNEAKELGLNSKKKEEELKCLESTFTMKMPDFHLKRTQAEVFKKQLASVQENFNKKNEEMTTKTENLKGILIKFRTTNKDLLEKLKENLQEQENFKKVNNIFEIKGKITKAESEIQILRKQIQEIETTMEYEQKQRKETQGNLDIELMNKNKATEQMKTSMKNKEIELESEIKLLTETFNEKQIFMENLKELVRKQKANFMKEFKECDDQKLRLFRETTYKKEAYDNKYRKFIEFAKQKSVQIDFQKLSTTDIEVEEMRESKRMLKNSFEIQMKDVLINRDTLRNSNSNLNEKHQAEMLKKTSWNMKLNRYIDEKKGKVESHSQNLREVTRLKGLKEKMTFLLNDLETNKNKIFNEYEKIKKNNEEMRKYWDSVSDIRTEIDEKKRERQWFNDIKKEISSQKDATIKKIKDMKKFKEKTQKELTSQKEALVKFKEKIDKLEKVFEDLERKNLELS